MHWVSSQCLTFDTKLFKELISYNTLDAKIKDSIKKKITEKE